MKDVLITGATGGMGQETVKILISQGYRVFACDIKTDMTATEGLIYIDMDVTNDNSILSAVKTISIYTNNLYAIVNLAGIFSMDSIIEGDEKKLRKMIDVNFWGAYKVNKAFFPMLKKGSRIINMSSELAAYSMHPFDGYYALPKVLLDNYTDVLRREAAYIGVFVTKIRAGSFKTGLVSRAEQEFDNLKSNTVHFSAPLRFFSKFVTKEFKRGADAKLVGSLILKIVSAKKPKICYKIKNSLKLKLLSALPESAQDKIYMICVKK